MAQENENIDFLLDELKNEDWSVREDAAELLAELGEATALALGLFEDKRAVKPLIKLMNDEKPNVRYGAALSLSILGDQQAINALQKATKDENSVVRKVAKVALKEIEDRE